MKRKSSKLGSCTTVLGWSVSVLLSFSLTLGRECGGWGYHGNPCCLHLHPSHLRQSPVGWLRPACVAGCIWKSLRILAQFFSTTLEGVSYLDLGSSSQYKGFSHLVKPLCRTWTWALTWSSRFFSHLLKVWPENNENIWCIMKHKISD